MGCWFKGPSGDPGDSRRAMMYHPFGVRARDTNGVLHHSPGCRRSGFRRATPGYPGSNPTLLRYPNGVLLHSLKNIFLGINLVISSKNVYTKLSASLIYLVRQSHLRWDATGKSVRYLAKRTTMRYCNCNIDLHMQYTIPISRPTSVLLKS